MNVLIKSHKTKALEFITNKENKPVHEIVEAWQKKQPSYLLRGHLEPCTFKAVDGGIIEAMRQSKGL